MAAKVLIVDDQENQRNMLADILAAEGLSAILQAGTVDDAISAIYEHKPQVVLTDLKMPGKSGLTLIEEIKAMPLPPEVIILTAFGSIDTAIKATKLGAYDYLTKPVNPEEVIFLIAKAHEKYTLRQESQILKQELVYEVGSNLVAQSKAMQKVIAMIETVAKTDSTVLIRGETGTGKECVARLIHLRSSRSSKPMKCFNCAALSETLQDSELFGYEKGAFTGAQARKIGIVEAASGGTLFLDEIGDMNQSTQAKILRTLQEKAIRRVGSTEDSKVDIRIITATNKNLETAVQSGAFRQDLFYRLNIVPITIPPLRDRKEDIPVLASHFFSKFGHSKEIDGAAMDALLEYDWPGNVRELEALVERMTIFSKEKTITINDLPPNISRQNANKPDSMFDIPAEGLVFEDWERAILSKALEKSSGNMVAAAKLLGMNYRAFRYRTNGFGLRGE